MDITILCKVVDNYGDIGFVYRLSRSLSIQRPQAKLRLIVSNMESFAAMAPGIKCGPAVQEYNGWQVLDWYAEKECSQIFTQTPPQIILECFQCGRPEWLDRILFGEKINSTVHIVNVEYLTAEPWADDFHLLKSGTRSPLVKKINFMPGFTKRTGGLLLDETFIKSRQSNLIAFQTFTDGIKNSLQAQNQIQELNKILSDKNIFTVIIFTYPRNFSEELKAFAEFESYMKNQNENFELTFLLSNSTGTKTFVEELNKSEYNFKTFQLPYMEQSAWDALLTLADCAFIRGEDSFARAVLSGRPFFWHAYIQDESFQLVKVQALLNLMKEKLPQCFVPYYRYMMQYNMTPQTEIPMQTLSVLEDAQPMTLPQNECGRWQNLLEVLKNFSAFSKGCREFSESVIANGDLCTNLLKVLDSFSAE